jgi:hypothetical protein
VDEAVQTEPVSGELKPAPGAAKSPDVPALNPDLAAKEMLFLSGMLDEGGQQQGPLDVVDLLKRANGDEDDVEKEDPVRYSTQTAPSLGGFTPASSLFREGRSLEDILKERAAMGQQSAGDVPGQDEPEGNSEEETSLTGDLSEKPAVRSLIQDITGTAESDQTGSSDDGSEEDLGEEEEDDDDDDDDDDEDESDEDEEDDEEDEELSEEDASEAALKDTSTAIPSSAVAPNSRAVPDEPMQADDVIEIGSSSDESEGQSDLEEEEEVLDLPEGDRRLPHGESFVGLESEEEEEEEELEEEELEDEEEENDDDDEEEDEEEAEEGEEAGIYDEDEEEEEKEEHRDGAFDETGGSGPTAAADSGFLWGHDERQSEVNDMVVDAPDAYQPQAAESSGLPSTAPDSRWSDFLYAENEDGDRPDIDFDESRDRAEEKDGELGNSVEQPPQAAIQGSSSINVDPRLLAQAALAGGLPQHFAEAGPSASSSLPPLLQTSGEAHPDLASSAQQDAQAESVSFPPSHPSEALSFDQTMAIRAATGVLTGPGSSLGSVGGASGAPSMSVRKAAQGENANAGVLPNSAEELMDFKQESDRLAVEHTQGQIQSGPPSVGATEGSEGTVQRRTSFSIEGTPDRAHRGRISAAHTPGPSAVPPLLDTPLASPSASSSSHSFFAPPLPRSGAALHLFKQSAANRAALFSAPASEGATADADDVAQNQKGLPTMDEDLAAATGDSHALTSFDQQQKLDFDPTESSRSLVELKEATQTDPAGSGQKGLSSLKSEPSATPQQQTGAASTEDGLKAVASSTDVDHPPEAQVSSADLAQPAPEAETMVSEAPVITSTEAGTAVEESDLGQPQSTKDSLAPPVEPQAQAEQDQQVPEAIANVLALLGETAGTLPETPAEEAELDDSIAVPDDARDSSDDDEVVDVDEHTEYEVESEGSVKAEPEEFVREQQPAEQYVEDSSDEEEEEDNEEERTYELGERTSYAVEEDGSVLMEPEEGGESQEDTRGTGEEPEAAEAAEEAKSFQPSAEEVLSLPASTEAELPTSAEEVMPPQPVSILISSDESDQEEDSPAAIETTQTTTSTASLGAVSEPGPSKPRSPSPASTQFSPRRQRQSKAQEDSRPSTADSGPPASPVSRQEKSLTALRKEWKMIKETEGASARPPAPQPQADEVDDPVEVPKAVQETQQAAEQPEEDIPQVVTSEAIPDEPVVEEAPISAISVPQEDEAPARHRHRHRHGGHPEKTSVIDADSADESEDQPPITRSHCRFAKLTFTGQISGERVTFVVPECSIRHDHLKEEGAVLLGAASKQDNNDKVLFDAEEMEESTYHRLSRLVGHEMLSDTWVMPDSAWRAECEAAKTAESETIGGVGEKAEDGDTLNEGSPVEGSPEELRPSSPHQETESDDELDVITKHSSPKGKVTPGRHRVTPNKKHHRPETGDRDWLPEQEDTSTRSSKKRGASVTPSTSNKRAKATKEEHPGFDADLSFDVLEGEAELSQENDIASQTPSKPARRRSTKRADSIVQSSDPPPSQETSTPNTRTRRRKLSEASPVEEDVRPVAPARRNSSAGKRKSVTPAPRDTSEAPSLVSPRKTPSRRSKRTLQTSAEPSSSQRSDAAEEQDETMDLDPPANEEAGDGDIDMDANDAQISTAVTRSTRAGSKRPARATRSSSRTLPEAGSSSASASQSSVTPRVTRAKARQSGKDAEEQ